MLACMCMTCQLLGQGFPSTAINVLDSSLTMLGMKHIDLAMPHDIIKPDKHRSPLQISLFEYPMLMGDIAMKHVQGVQALIHDSSETWFAQIMQDGHLGSYTQQYLHDELTAGEIDKLIGHQLDRITNLTTAVLLRQYLGPILYVIQQTEKSRLRLLKDSLLIQQADSLLMLSQESESLSLYALKQSEIEGMDLAKKFFSRADPPKDIITHGLSLIASYPKLFSIAEKLREDYVKDLKPLRLNTPFGTIAIGSSGNDVYEGNFLLILDPAGNDVYAIKGGKQQALQHPVQCIIDFSGDDQYRGGDFTLGSGYFGIGILHDLEGNDMYSAGDVSLGTGIFGVGYVHDKSGADIYSSKTNTQARDFLALVSCTMNRAMTSIPFMHMDKLLQVQEVSAFYPIIKEMIPISVRALSKMYYAMMIISNLSRRERRLAIVPLLQADMHCSWIMQAMMLICPTFTDRAPVIGLALEVC